MHFERPSIGGLRYFNLFKNHTIIRILKMARFTLLYLPWCIHLLHSWFNCLFYAEDEIVPRALLNEFIPRICHNSWKYLPFLSILNSQRIYLLIKSRNFFTQNIVYIYNPLMDSKCAYFFLRHLQVHHH